VLREVFGPEREGLGWDWNRWHIEDRDELHPSIGVVRVMQ
jgi:hypothetical protein